MYTYPNLSSILSSLSLTLAELKVFQDNIDSILTNKNIINNHENIAVNYISDTLSKHLAQISKLSGYDPVTVASLENVNLGLLSEQSITHGLIQLQQLEQLKNAPNQNSSSAQKPDRPLGVWKGKVRMSDDFNELSSDILSEFGIEE